MRFRRLREIVMIAAILLPLFAFAFVYILRLDWAKNYKVAYNLWWIFIIAAPIWEELLFRGVIQDWLISKLKNVGIAMLLTNLLFALMHYRINGGDLIYLGAVLFCGVMFSLIKFYYRRIIYPILIHAYYNLVYLFMYAYLKNI